MGECVDEAFQEEESLSRKDGSLDHEKPEDRAKILLAENSPVKPLMQKQATPQDHQCHNINPDENMLGCETGIPDCFLDDEILAYEEAARGFATDDDFLDFHGEPPCDQIDVLPSLCKPNRLKICGSQFWVEICPQLDV